MWDQINANKLLSNISSSTKFGNYEHLTNGIEELSGEMSEDIWAEFIRKYFEEREEHNDGNSE